MSHTSCLCTGIRGKRMHQNSIFFLSTLTEHEQQKRQQICIFLFNIVHRNVSLFTVTLSLASARSRSRVCENKKAKNLILKFIPFFVFINIFILFHTVMYTHNKFGFLLFFFSIKCHICCTPCCSYAQL